MERFSDCCRWVIHTFIAYDPFNINLSNANKSLISMSVKFSFLVTTDSAKLIPDSPNILIECNVILALYPIPV